MRLTAARWGVLSLALAAVAFTAEILWERYLQRWDDVRLVPFILLQLAVAACAVIAGRLGKRMWFLLSAFNLILAAQAALAFLVGD